MKANSRSHLLFLVFVSGFLVSGYPIFSTFQGETQLSLFAHFQVCIWSHLETKNRCPPVSVNHGHILLHSSITCPWLSTVNIYFSHCDCRGWGFSSPRRSLPRTAAAAALIHESFILFLDVQVEQTFLTETAEVKRAGTKQASDCLGSKLNMTVTTASFCWPRQAMWPNSKS